ncbi:GIY-YIG nuclease family protein [Patescibacteria group bacterium]
MFIVYILKSIKTARYYIGYTGDVVERLDAHNRGSVRSTKYFRPWKIIYTEEYFSRTEAIRREKEIKCYKGGNQFKQLLELDKD